MRKVALASLVLLTAWSVTASQAIRQQGRPRVSGAATQSMQADCSKVDTSVGNSSAAGFISSWWSLAALGLSGFFLTRLPAKLRPAGLAGPGSRPGSLKPRRQRMLRDLSWEEFVILIGELFRRQGFEVEIPAPDRTPRGFHLALRHAGERILVQGRHWNRWQVRPKELQEFGRVLAAERVTRGIFVTSGVFTRDAREWAAGQAMELIDGPRLTELVGNFQTDPEHDPLDVGLWAGTFGLSAEAAKPSCPFCATPMRLRRGWNGSYWACATSATCHGKREARARLHGAKTH